MGVLCHDGYERVTDGHRRWAPRRGSAWRKVSAAAERPEWHYMRAGLVGVLRSVELACVLGHRMRLWSEGGTSSKESIPVKFGLRRITGMSDLTCITCGSSGMVGSSNTNLVDLMPGSGVYWGPVYSGIYANKARCEWLSSEKRLAWYGWGTWIVVHRWKSLVAGWAWLFVDQHCSWGWENGFSAKVSFLEGISCCRIVLKKICKVLFNYLAYLDNMR